MSDRPMTVPTDVGSSRYCELRLCLPADWPISAEAFQDQRAYWPISLLKTIARLPHEYNTWIAQWHSVPDGDPAQHYAPGTPFVGVLVTPMLRCEPAARTMTIVPNNIARDVEPLARRGVRDPVVHPPTTCRPTPRARPVRPHQRTPAQLGRRRPSAGDDS
jgi:hypothetical protein